MLLERSGALHAVEVKTACATSPYLARGLKAILEDTGAISATIIDQGKDAEPLAVGISRRGFGLSGDWFPT